jgi:hypothetical protein
VVYVFDRSRSSHHWESVLNLPGGGPTDEAVLESWRMDPRVHEDREAAVLALDHFRSPPRTFADWKGQVEVHHRSLGWQVFRESTNRNNWIPRGSLPPDEELVHVVSFGRLIGFLLTNRRAEFELAWTFNFPRLPTLPHPRDQDYLDRIWNIAGELNAQGLPEVQRMAGFLADTLGLHEPPWWAGFAAELGSFFRDEDWLGLSRVLGLGHLEAGETLLVFCYPVNDALTAAGAQLLRPTVIEAATYPCHFPSPASASYGFTMPLELGTTRYCRELIHPPLKGSLAAGACARPLVRLVSRVMPDYDRLPDLRAQQRLRLEREWSDLDTQEWLRRHSPIERP